MFTVRKVADVRCDAIVGLLPQMRLKLAEHLELCLQLKWVCYMCLATTLPVGCNPRGKQRCLWTVARRPLCYGNSLVVRVS
jgi:hypothetical protein